VNWPNKFRLHTVREDVLSPEPRNVLVQALDVRHAAAKNDHFGIKNVDHMSEAARQPVLVSAKTRFSRRIIGFR
jgi:hypothetical protein